MDPPSTYADLSILPDKVIDGGYFLNKVKANGYSIAALDYELTDPKPNVFHLSIIVGF